MGKNSISDVARLMDNGHHSLFRSEGGRERMRLRAMVTGRSYQWIGDVTEGSHVRMDVGLSIGISPYHFEGKVNFEGVENVTP
ncbi:hypothetical protein Tco_0212335 [Tanacetum coccineum]